MVPGWYPCHARGAQRGLRGAVPAPEGLLGAAGAALALLGWELVVAVPGAALQPGAPLALGTIPAGEAVSAEPSAALLRLRAGLGSGGMRQLRGLYWAARLLLSSSHYRVASHKAS